MDERTVGERFWSKVDASGDCWKWTGASNNVGYGTFYANSTTTGAHRWAWEFLVGPILEGFEIDHLCRNRSCVNPDHLEVVDRRTNILRSQSFIAEQAHQSHCKWGHPLVESNVYVPPEHPTWRTCRTCKRRRKRESARRQAALA